MLSKVFLAATGHHNQSHMALICPSRRSNTLCYHSQRLMPENLPRCFEIESVLWGNGIQRYVMGWVGLAGKGEGK